VIRREEAAGDGGHHGGAWKVAYADFVTAMMAFFLLMWLLNATTEAQRRGLADYFTPTNALSHASSGTGKPFGGLTPFESGQEVSNLGVQAVVQGNAPPPADTASTDQPDGAGDASADSEEDGHAGQPAPVTQQGKGLAGGGQASATSLAPARADYLAQAASGSAATPDARATDPSSLSDAALRAELAHRETAEFEGAAAAMRQAVAGDPALAGLGQQLAIDTTPQGLRIQVLDADRTPMFASGSAVLSDRARLLIGKIAPVLARLRQPISISGHTDATAYRGGDRTNWELSSDRANATRRLLSEAGLDETRFRSVSGDADRDPLLPADPMAAANRRIAITLLRLSGTDATSAGSPVPSVGR
jgi:chemotaxis protein MotB